MSKKHYFDQHSLNFERLKRVTSNRLLLSDDLIPLMHAYESAIDFYNEYLSHSIDPEVVKHLKLSRLALVQLASMVSSNNEPGFSVGEIRLRSFEGGLANRLRALCAAMVIANISNKNLEISWVPDDHCDLDFDIMFPDGLLNNFVKKKPSFYIESILALNGSCFEIVGNPSAWVLWDKYCKEIIDWGGFYILYRKFLNEIFNDNLNPLLLAKANKLLNQNIMDDVIGLHIRSTDFQRHYELTYPDRKLAEVDDFIALLHDCSHSKVFLATDSIAVKHEFVMKFRGEIINAEHSFQVENFRQTSIESALCDIYTLSKCKSLIATYGSSFSGMAADLSGGEILYI
ncbi:hypothetical protein LMORI2_12080 [Limnohabitans sp. MORI2]|uniref:hypothetical protein n=1 Tax=Limnohabitans sp. MORI2 TaxID=1751150 RepID=UPI0023772A82|nr:hypothetical protein [Limnohabitans sp. MORI2]BDU58226.1 hypothetical protein LMORI2_12080 [Limnohabitans sp. MORI2]